MTSSKPGQPVHLELLVEEYSAKVTLDILLPRLLGPEASFTVHAFDGRAQLLSRLEQRLRGYRRYPENTRVLDLVDRDNDDCLELKARLERAAKSAGLPTLSTARGAPETSDPIRVCNRIACEELEAWFLGDPAALSQAYPKVKPSYADQARHRAPDAVSGGTWEALERLLRRAGYYRERTRLPKVEVARAIAPHLDPDRTNSPSFRAFATGVRRLAGGLSRN